MKKEIIVRDAALGGLLGILISKFSDIVYVILTQGFTETIKEEILSNSTTFLIFAICFGIFSIVYHKKNNELQELTIEQRENILKKSRLYLIILEFLTLIINLVLLILHFPIYVIAIILLLSVAILIWLFGAHLGCLDLKKRIKEIKKN